MRAISATLLMHTYTTPATAPMQMAAQGSTYAHPAQMATIPVIDPASKSTNQSTNQSIGQSVAMIRERGKPHRIASNHDTVAQHEQAPVSSERMHGVDLDSSHKSHFLLGVSELHAQDRRQSSSRWGQDGVGGGSSSVVGSQRASDSELRSSVERQESARERERHTHKHTRASKQGSIGPRSVNQSINRCASHDLSLSLSGSSLSLSLSLSLSSLWIDRQRTRTTRRRIRESRARSSGLECCWACRSRRIDRFEDRESLRRPMHQCLRRCARLPSQQSPSFVRSIVET